MHESPNSIGQHVDTAKSHLAEGDKHMANATAQNQDALATMTAIARGILEIKNAIAALTTGDTDSIPAIQSAVGEAYEQYGYGENTLVIQLEGSNNPHASNAKGMAGALAALVGSATSEISVSAYLRSAVSEMSAAAYAIDSVLTHVDKANLAIYNATTTAHIATSSAGEGMSQVITEELTLYQQDLGYTG